MEAGGAAHRRCLGAGADDRSSNSIEVISIKAYQASDVM
jgi:hypothetical protein